jgi:hypothetical protein
MIFQTNEIPEFPYSPSKSNDLGMKTYVFGTVSTIERIGI